MQTYKIHVQLKAQNDLLRIYDYIRFTLFNDRAADDFVGCLEKRYAQIANNPHIFSSELINGRLYKKAMCKRYIIIFRIDEQLHTVHIVAIGHSRQKRKNIIKA